MTKFWYRFIPVNLLLFIEILMIWHFKNRPGSFLSATGETFTVYLQNHGGIEFFFSGYIQRETFFALLCYSLISVLLILNQARTHQHLRKTNFSKLNFGALGVNLLTFLLIIISFFLFDSPIELINYPFSLKSISYSFSPFLWFFFLISACDLLFSVSDFIKEVNRDKFLIFSIFLITYFSLHLAVTDFSENFWFALLIVPTVYLASGIATIIGFNAHASQGKLGEAIIFGTDRFQVDITFPCSGYEGMTLIIILLVAYCFLQRNNLKLPKSLIIIPIASLAMFLLNAVRLVILIAIGDLYSPEIALKGFHSVAGWLNLLVVLILSILTLNYASFFSRSNLSQISPPIRGRNISLLLLPLAGLIATSLFTKTVTADFDWLYPVPIAIALLLLFYFRDYFHLFLSSPSFFSAGMGVLVFIMWIILIPVDESQSLHFFEQIQAAPIWISLGWLLCRIIGASVVVPIVEELAFRGFMLPSLEGLLNSVLANIPSTKYSPKNIKMLSTFLSLAITSLLFGLLHSDILAGSVAGLCYGLVYLKKRSLVDAITAHGVTNALLAIDVIYFGNWSYW